MPSLVALIVVLVATAASARPAESPEWYAGLRSRAVCGAAMSATATPWRPELTTTQGTKRSRRTGRGTRSSTARCCPSPPPMAATMPAGATRREDPTFAASSFPAWPFSPLGRVQLESLLAFPVKPEERPAAHSEVAPGLAPGSEHSNNLRCFDGVTQPRAHVEKRGV
jgi:hypothetical protein